MTKFTNAERRIIRFLEEGKKETSHEPEAAELKSDEKEDFTDLFNESPTLKRFTSMSNDDYRRELQSGKSAEEIVQMTEAGTDMDNAVNGMMRDMENMEKLFDFNDPNFSFEKAMSSIGAMMDKHILPLMRKYAKNPKALLDGASQMLMAQRVKDDLASVKSGTPIESFVSPGADILEMLSGKNSYDRALQKKLAAGGNLETISEETQAVIGNADENEQNVADARGMLKAISRLKRQRELMGRNVNDTLTLGKFSEKLEVAIDPKDAEIYLRIQPELMEDFIAKNPDSVQKNGDSVTIKINTRTYRFRLDKTENTYELISQ